MDSSPNAPTILDTLRTVEFRLGIKGYNVDEVDEYLDRAAQEAEAMQENVRQLTERLRQASDRIVQLEKEAREVPVAAAPAPAVVVAEAATPVPAPTPAPAPVPAASDLGPSDETLQRTLLLAQKFVDQIKRESEAEAAATVAQAEETARLSITRAEETAKTLRFESERQVREEVARLEATRTELATDVESMARHLESERNRLRDALTEILTWVDENVQPANSLIGVRPKAPVAAAPKAIQSVSGATAESSEASGVDDVGQPTLSLQVASDMTESGVAHPS